MYNTATPEGPPRGYSTRAEIIDALDGARSDGVRYSETLGYDLMYVADPVASGGTCHGAVRINFRLENLETELPTTLRPELDAATTETDRLARLVDGLLTIARTSGIEPSLDVIDLAAVLHDRQRLWTPQAAAQGVELQVEPSAAVPVLAAFDRFWRSPSNEKPGSGLGRAIVAELAEASQGKATLTTLDARLVFGPNCRSTRHGGGRRPSMWMALALTSRSWAWGCTWLDCSLL